MPDIARLLIERGAEVNVVDTRNGTTPLLWACAKTMPDVAQMLIEHAGFSTSEEVEIQVMCHLRSWREGGASLVTDTVKQLTGRDPMSVEQWIQENQAVFLG